MDIVLITYGITLLLGAPMAIFIWIVFRRRVDSPWARMLVSSILVATLIAPSALGVGHGQPVLLPAVLFATGFALGGLRDGNWRSDSLWLGVAPIALVAAAIFGVRAVAHTVDKLARWLIQFPTNRPTKHVDDRIQRRLAE